MNRDRAAIELKVSRSIAAVQCTKHDHVCAVVLEEGPTSWPSALF